MCSVQFTVYTVQGSLKCRVHSLRCTVYTVQYTMSIVKCYFCIPALPEAPRISSLQPTADRVAATLKSSILDTTKLQRVHCADCSVQFNVTSIVGCWVWTISAPYTSKTTLGLQWWKKTQTCFMSIRLENRACAKGETILTFGRKKNQLFFLY